MTGDASGWTVPPAAEQSAFVIAAVMADPLACEVLERAHRLGLPDWALMAGAVYKAVWNAQTGRPGGYGINDYDLAYFDAGDLGAAAEANVVGPAEARFADLPVPVEICNQARVHIWFNEAYGTQREALVDTTDALRHFASLTHAVAIRLDRHGRPELLAPLGLEAVFSRTIRPMPGLAGPEAWNRKIAEQARLWPELDFVPAPV
ncbi:nucleotidyltransferase family protein [Maricaulis sp.]|uniref:nucleotidyltransferase family protein n=1 Tax=Maricaulis sp. TaxID=1486257 RepID=UPI002B26E955|nr:nucleotidyltransferase family protein [Maricaulis sp.]